MNEALMQALVSFVAVSGGLLVLWTLIWRNRMPATVRLTGAVVAGLVSASVTFAFTVAIG